MFKRKVITKSTQGVQNYTTLKEDRTKGKVTRKGDRVDKTVTQVGYVKIKLITYDVKILKNKKKEVFKTTERLYKKRKRLRKIKYK